MPKELDDPLRRLAKIREAKAALEAEAQQAAEGNPPQAEARGGRGPPPQGPETVRPGPPAQRNFTDPDSRFIQGPDGSLQADNTQTVVEVGSQVIPTYTASKRRADARNLQPMVEQVIRNTRGRPRRLVADPSC